jgi:menaquinol-cytochrome c reductase iron-sulfur subunit
MRSDESFTSGDDRNGGGRDEALAPGRRRLLTRVTIAAGGVIGVLAGLPLLGILISPMRQGRASAWRPVGPVEQFPIGSTSKVSLLDPDPVPWSGPSGRSAAWLRRDGWSEFVAFSLYCTHTGCPIRWDDGAELFLCPCHGGVFYRDGSVAAGPPPAPLERHPVRIRDGMVEVRTIGVPTPGV